MFESKNIAIFKFVVETKHRSAAMTLPNRRASVEIKYRKIPKGSPGAYIFQRPFFKGLIF